MTPVPDDRWLPWLQRAVWAVFLAGLLGLLLVGSDSPADPSLGPPAGPPGTPAP